MANPPTLVPDENNYVALLEGLKQRIQSSQVKAALAVNQELILLYWHIGQEILTRQQEQGWGSKVIDRLAQDLKREFPEMKGFGARNLKYMRTFAEAWPDEQIVHQLGALIPWRHNCVLLDKVKDPTERIWYTQQTIAYGWSRNVLTLQVTNNLYHQQSGAVTNFERTLPKPQSDLASSLIKDPYHLDFLTVDVEVKEQDLKRALVKHMRDFLLELGIGFSFVGSNYPLNIGDKDFYLDLLFYHLELRCFVIINIKMGEFQAEHSGLMNLYIAAVDEQKRKEYDQPTIGIILCKTKNTTIAEYALRNLRNPIAVATHELPQKLQNELPSAEQLQTELESAVQRIETQGVKATES